MTASAVHDPAGTLPFACIVHSSLLSPSPSPGSYLEAGYKCYHLQKWARISHSFLGAKLGSELQSRHPEHTGHRTAVDGGGGQRRRTQAEDGGGGPRLWTEAEDRGVDGGVDGGGGRRLCIEAEAGARLSCRFVCGSDGGLCHQTAPSRVAGANQGGLQVQSPCLGAKKRTGSVAALLVEMKIHWTYWVK